MEAAMLLSGIIEAAERNRTQRSSDYTDADGFLCRSANAVRGDQ